MDFRSLFQVIVTFSVALLLDRRPILANGETHGPCSVTVKNGIINGQEIKGNVCSYTAIPYASPPLGPLRFKAPQPAKPWDILNATSLPNWCPQGQAPPPELKVKMSEDCLYLNLYQPKVENGSKAGLPVMIWFHGGGFVSGSSVLYTPSKLLARDDVILVVANYRLGLLGFLSTGDGASPGNYGLKDQSFSIQWVHENIKAFGGDPNKITIFGESAGKVTPQSFQKVSLNLCGASVMFQLISPLNKGKISGAIAQSGDALSFWALNPDPLASAKALGKLLGCPTVFNSWLVSCLRKVDWERIIKVQPKFALPFAALAPVVEPDLPGAFITQTPENIMRKGDIPNIPVMIGANKHDGSFILAGLYQSVIGPLKLDKNPGYMREKLVPDMLKFMRVQGDESNGAVAASLEMTYLSGVNRSSWEESMPGLVDMLTVFLFKAAAEKSAEILSRRNVPVYLYSFEHHSNNTLWSLIGSNNVPVDHGIAHADELIYLFDFPVPGLRFSETDTAFSGIMCDMWLNFAKHGNPTPEPRENVDEWKPYSVEEESFMKLNITPTLLHGYRSSWRPNGFEWS